jgi:hypothetical protein
MYVLCAAAAEIHSTKQLLSGMALFHSYWSSVESGNIQKSN